MKLFSHVTMLGILALLSLASSAHAATYQPLVNIPQLQGGGGAGLGSYFNQLYMVSVAIGAILAFIKIAIAGVKYSLSDVVTNKADAKEDIRGALFGLAILLIPFIVLYTINPELTKLNILEGATPVNLGSSSVPPGTTYVNTVGQGMSPGIVVQNIDCDLLSTSSGDVESGAPTGVNNNYNCDSARAQCTSYGGSFVPQQSYIRCSYTQL